MNCNERARRLDHVIFHLGIGGGEQFLADLGPALAQHRLEQHVWCIGPSGPLAAPLQAASIPVTALHKSTRVGLGAAARLTLGLRRTKPFAVLTHGEAGVIWGLPAAAAAGVPLRVALVYQNYEETRLRMTAMKCLLPLADHVVAGSASVAAFVEQALGIAHAKMSTILCGIATERFRDVRRRPGNRQTTILSIGRLVPRKGHHVLLRAAVSLCRAGLDFRVVIVGDGPCRSELTNLASALGIGDRVELRSSIWPDLPAWEGADVFAFPSLVEPQGLVVLEAFAAGVPVVASNTGGIPEMIESERSGLLVPPGDSSALANALERVLRDPDMAARLAAGGKRRLEEFDICRIAESYQALFRRLWAERECGRGMPGRRSA